MAVFTILYGNYYPSHGEIELICIGKFARWTWVNFTQQYGKIRQRCQKNKFTVLYGNYCYIFLENFPQKFSPCITIKKGSIRRHSKIFVDHTRTLSFSNESFSNDQSLTNKKLQPTFCKPCAVAVMFSLASIRLVVYSSSLICWINCGVTRNPDCSHIRLHFSTTLVTTSLSLRNRRSNGWATNWWEASREREIIHSNLSTCSFVTAWRNWIKFLVQRY